MCSNLGLATFRFSHWIWMQDIARHSSEWPEVDRHTSAWCVFGYFSANFSIFRGRCLCSRPQLLVTAISNRLVLSGECNETFSLNAREVYTSRPHKREYSKNRPDWILRSHGAECYKRLNFNRSASRLVGTNVVLQVVVYNVHRDNDWKTEFPVCLQLVVFVAAIQTFWYWKFSLSISQSSQLTEDWEDILSYERAMSTRQWSS